MLCFVIIPGFLCLQWVIVGSYLGNYIKQSEWVLCTQYQSMEYRVFTSVYIKKYCMKFA